MDFSAAALFASFLVGTVGLGFYLYGKKQLRVPQLVVGLLMMVYPCFIQSVVIVYLVAVALIGALWFAVRIGGW